VTEPTKWAVLCLLDDLLESVREEIHVADIGCGDHQLAKFLQEEVQKHDKLKGTTIHLHAYDISPNCYDYHKYESTNIKIKYYPSITFNELNIIMIDKETSAWDELKKQ